MRPSPSATAFDMSAEYSVEMSSSVKASISVSEDALVETDPHVHPPQLDVADGVVELGHEAEVSAASTATKRKEPGPM